MKVLIEFLHECLASVAVWWGHYEIVNLLLSNKVKIIPLLNCLVVNALTSQIELMRRRQKSAERKRRCFST